MIRWKCQSRDEKALEQLIRATNVYMSSVSDVRRGATLLMHIQRYFNKMMDAFSVTPFTAAATAATSGMATGEEVPLFSIPAHSLRG